MPKYRRSYRPRPKSLPQYQVGTYAVRQQARNRDIAFKHGKTWYHTAPGSAMSFPVRIRDYVRGKPNPYKYAY